MGPLLFPEQSFKKEQAAQQAPQQAAPMSMLEQMDERHGKLKSRLGLFSHLYNGGSRSDYGDEDMLAAQKARQTQAAMQDKMGMAQPFFDLLQSDNRADQMKGMFALEQLGFSDSMMKLGMPESQAASELPDATRAVIHYQDSLNRYVDPESGEVMMRQPGQEGYVKYADAFDRYKNREVGGLREQSAAKAEGGVLGKAAGEEVTGAPAEAATMNSAMSTIESLGTIGTDPETGEVTFTPDNLGEFEDVYGNLDRFKPFGFSEEETFIRNTVEKIGSILAVDARGKLKGQGQISDKETAMLEKSLSILSSRGISPQRAREEIARIYSIMQKGFMQKQEVINQSRGGSSSGPSVGFVDDGYRFKGGDPNDPNSWEAVQ